MIGLIIGTVIVCLITIYIIVTYNSLISSKNLVKEAFSTMDVYLKKRWDLLPNLTQTVKGYSSYEKEVLEDVTKLRNGKYDDLSIENKIDVNTKIDSNIASIFALKEGYPELKSNENFLNLMNDLTKIEDDIANSRKYYNGAVRKLNNKVLMFPSNIVASIFGIKKEKMFEAKENEKESVKVNL